MRRELRKLQKENAALAQRVQSGRDTITHTEQRISAAVDEWKVTVRERVKYLTVFVYCIRHCLVLALKTSMLLYIYMVEYKYIEIVLEMHVELFLHVTEVNVSYLSGDRS